MSKETRYKLRMIKKYAKIRFKRFWKEWGLAGYELADLIASAGILVFLLALSTIISVI